LPTERGKTIQTLIRNNAQLGVSIRGFGEVGKNGVVDDSYKLVGLDIVMNPSFKNAVFSKNNVFESVEFSEKENQIVNDEALEEQINELEKESWLSACESGYSGSQEDWERQYSGSLREMMGLPKAEGKMSVEKLTEEAIQARTYSYYQEAVQSGYKGDFNAWKERFPKIIEQAKEKKVVLSERKEEPKIPFKSKSTWAEIKLSGFAGTMQEFEEKFPNITIIKLESPKKVVVEQTIKEQAAKIFVALSKDSNNQLTLEDIQKLLEKEEIAKSDQRLRKRAIHIVNVSLAGSGSSPSQQTLSKMVEDEIEHLKKLRQERRERNWSAYEKLLR